MNSHGTTSASAAASTSSIHTAAIYHEKQQRELCALHTLNNLFQERNSFTKFQLDEICRSLSPDEWINPHRSVLGLGNYDVNVILSAVQSKGYAAVWFDKRKHPSCIDTDQVFGFILNVPSEYKIGFVTLPLRRRHWIALRKINTQYWNLDSKLNRPQSIGDEACLVAFLDAELQAKDKELFLIVDNEVDQQQKWQRPVASINNASTKTTATATHNEHKDNS